MRAKGVGQVIAPRKAKSGVHVTRNSPKEAVRVQPETWRQLAELRRPLLDPEGNLVAFESFDRVVRRLLAERRSDTSLPEQSQEVQP